MPVGDWRGFPRVGAPRPRGPGPLWVDPDPRQCQKFIRRPFNSSTEIGGNLDLENFRAQVFNNHHRNWINSFSCGLFKTIMYLLSNINEPIAHKDVALGE